MIIQMIAGTFGLKNKSGFITPKTPKDGPFCVSDEVGKRLVEQLKIAKIVEETGEGESNSPTPTPASGEKQQNPYFMKKEDLVKIAEEKGLDTRGLNKNDIIAKLAENSTKDDQNAGGEEVITADETPANNQENDGGEGKEADETGDDDDIVIDDGTPAPTFDTTGAIK